MAERVPNEPVRRTDGSRKAFSWILGIIALVLIIWFLYALFNEPEPGVDVEPVPTTFLETVPAPLAIS